MGVKRVRQARSNAISIPRVSIAKWPACFVNTRWRSTPSGVLAQPGDSFAIDVAGLPLLLVRAEDGRINAFANVCGHRGARGKSTGMTSNRALVCPHHSWSYRLDGTLRDRRHAEDFPHAPVSECSLARVPSAQALGFVWVVPRVLAAGESAELDIRTWLGPFGENLCS